MIDSSLDSFTERRGPGLSRYNSSSGAFAARENNKLFNSAFLWPSTLLHKTLSRFMHSPKNRRRATSLTNFRKFAVSGDDRPGRTLFFFFGGGVHGSTDDFGVWDTRCSRILMLLGFFSSPTSVSCQN